MFRVTMIALPFLSPYDIPPSTPSTPSTTDLQGCLRLVAKARNPMHVVFQQAMLGLGEGEANKRPRHAAAASEGVRFM